MRARSPLVADNLVQALAILALLAPLVSSGQRMLLTSSARRGATCQPGMSHGPPQLSLMDPPTSHAARACDQHAFRMHFATWSPASRALLLSQAGPHAARALTVRPTPEGVPLGTTARRARRPEPLHLGHCPSSVPLPVSAKRGHIAQEVFRPRYGGIVQE